MSIAEADGQEAVQVPHWMQVRSRCPAGVRRSGKVGSRFTAVKLMISEVAIVKKNLLTFTARSKKWFVVLLKAITVGRLGESTSLLADERGNTHYIISYFLIVLRLSRTSQNLVKVARFTRQKLHK
jgi:hypothetical protein